MSTETLVELFEHGLDAPICLTWELTYACNLACVHCLSSSGRRDPGELSTAECQAVIDTLERMQVFYVNIGGGEPTVRPDFWELVDYATAHHVGVKFSTNGVRIGGAAARRLAASDYVDVQISLDGATAEVNDAVRGQGSYAMAIAAMEHLAAAGFRGFKISVVVTRQNAGQLDEFQALAGRYGAQLRLTRLRPSGRGADVWDELHPTAGQQRELYDWLCAHGEQVLTGDSFFHLAAYGEALPGLNMCGAGRVVCLIDPVGDVYACPFAIHESFLAGNVRARRLRGGLAGFRAVRRAARALRGRRLRLVPVLRLVPGWLHGREVLHRPAAGRPGPGVRPRLRGAGAARASTSRAGPGRGGPGRAPPARAGSLAPRPGARPGPQAGPGDDRAPPGARAAGPGL